MYNINVGFTDSSGQEDETQLVIDGSLIYVDQIVELFNLLLSLKDELDLDKVTYLEYAGEEPEDSD